MAAAPDGTHQPKTAHHCPQEPEKAERWQAKQRGPCLYRHDDGGADDQRGNHQGHGQPVGRAINLVAHALEVGQFNAYLHPATPRVAQQAAQVVWQALQRAQRLPHGLPGTPRQGARLVACPHHLLEQGQGF